MQFVLEEILKVFIAKKIEVTEEMFVQVLS